MGNNNMRQAAKLFKIFLTEPEQPTANFTGEDFAKFKRTIEKRGRAAASAIAAPIDATLAQPTNTCVFMRSTMPELRGRDQLRVFLKRFRSCTFSNRCNTALHSGIIAGTTRAELERLHSNKLVAEAFLTWGVLTKALEKEIRTLVMVVDIGSFSEA